MPHRSGSPEPTGEKAGESSSNAPSSKATPGSRFTASDVFFGADGLRAIWGILLFLALRETLVLCASPVVQTLVAPGSGSLRIIAPRTLLVYEGAGLLCVVLATWIMAAIERPPGSTYGLGGRRRLANFLAGLGWGAALLSLLIFTLRRSGLLVFDGRLLSGGNALRYGAVWLAGFLLVGMLEEVLFRGYLQFTLARGISEICDCFHVRNRTSVNFWTSAVLLSFGFALTHRSNAGESPIGLLAAGLIGVVFCLSLWRTGSLWWAIGFHASWDWAQSFLYGVADSGNMAEGHLFATHPLGRPILSGGITGPEGSLFILPIAALSAAVIVFTLPRTGAESTPDAA